MTAPERVQPTGTPSLAMQEVSKRFGATRAMDHVSFELAPRELLALVGPSGCGKSTTLRVAAGLLAADEGSVRLSGQLVDDSRTHVPPERRRIGLVFQEHALFPHLTVGRNVAFGIRGQPRAAVRHRVVEMLEMVGLAGMADRYPHELSGGERQRVALARSLAPEPALLLLDEPFASLDPNLRTKVRTEVVDILHHTGTPTMFVTHDQGEALAVGDRVAVMRAGRIEQIGEPVQVFHRPANRFVAAFMGEADFLDLDDPLVRAAGTVEAGETPVPHTGPIGGPGVAMVRPDDITFEVDTGGDTEILGTEFRGSSWCYTLALPSGTVVRSLRSHLAHVPAGTKVRATIKPGHRPVVVPDDAAVD